MKNYDRVFVIVLDSLGIGAMPDSANFGDTGVDTFGENKKYGRRNFYPKRKKF